VRAWDPATLLASAIVLLPVTIAATLLPARRAAGVDPWSAVHAE
jgi:hypothetical protein